MSNKIDLKDLINAGVQFGHQTSRWCPKMGPYIWGHKNKVHLINVAATAEGLEKAAQFLSSLAAENKQILFVGTKKAAQEAIERIGKETNSPWVTYRWIGGTLTNWSQVKKSRTRLLHFTEVLEKSDQFSYTKKERNRLQKIVKRLQDIMGGILSLRPPIGAIFIVDPRKEQAALKEAVTVGIPVVAIVDTNSDPTLIDYVIPANDDSAKSVSLLLNYLGEAIRKGKEAASQKAAQEQEARSAEAASAESDGGGVAESSVEALGPVLESDEEGVAREQARARKLRETIKAKKGDVRRPLGRARRTPR